MEQSVAACAELRGLEMEVTPNIYMREEKVRSRQNSMRNKQRQQEVMEGILSRAIAVYRDLKRMLISGQTARPVNPAEAEWQQAGWAALRPKMPPCSPAQCSA